MDTLWLAFFTGLTTGGLSCLAVQGGLLASSLAQQFEQELISTGSAPGKRQAETKNHAIALPILLFLSAKLTAYTLLGLLLGTLGSMLQLTAATRAILLVAIGIFMLGNALRMFNIHPIFRFFAFEPPKTITRLIRRAAKNNQSVVSPLLLGTLTVLIPCGVTQSMMATALGTGSPWAGAALMFAFTLGTSPIFFAISYFATRLGATLERYFLRFVAVMVLLMGLVSINSGLSLIGSPLAVTNLFGNDPPNPIQAAGPTHGSTYTIKAGDYGYEPKILKAAAGAPIQLNLVTQNTTGCARSIVFNSLQIEKVLPVSGTVSIQVPAQPKGTVIRYACSMGMYTGQIVFE